MRLLKGIALLAALPVLAILAIMAGPVFVIVLCAVGFGLIAFLLIQAAIGVGLLARAAERGTMRHLRGQR